MVFLIVGNSAFAQQRMLSVYDQTGSVKCVVAVDSIRLSRQGTSITGLYLVTSLTDVSLPKKGKGRNKRGGETETAGGRRSDAPKRRKRQEQTGRFDRFDGA